MKKVVSLLNSGLNLNAKFTNKEMKEVYAAGNFAFKDGDNKVYPVMITVEGYEENLSFLRLSLRGAGSGEIIKGLYQIIVFYLNPV